MSSRQVHSILQCPLSVVEIFRTWMTTRHPQRLINYDNDSRRRLVLPAVKIPPQKEDQVGLARPIPIAIVVVHYKHIVVVAGPSQSQLAVYYVPEEASDSSVPVYDTPLPDRLPSVRLLRFPAYCYATSGWGYRMEIYWRIICRTFCEQSSERWSNTMKLPPRLVPWTWPWLMTLYQNQLKLSMSFACRREGLMTEIERETDDGAEMKCRLFLEGQQCRWNECRKFSVLSNTNPPFLEKWKLVLPAGAIFITSEEFHKNPITLLRINT